MKSLASTWRSKHTMGCAATAIQVALRCCLCPCHLSEADRHNIAWYAGCDLLHRRHLGHRKVKEGASGEPGGCVVEVAGELTASKEGEMWIQAVVFYAEGLHALDHKVEAITMALAPNNVQELWSFLSLLNYYGWFVPNLASILYPLNTLSRRNTKWKWSKECEQAFKLAKEKLVSSEMPQHMAEVQSYRTQCPMARSDLLLLLLRHSLTRTVIIPR